MILKFMNPVFNAPQITNISDAFIAKGVDDDGNETDKWVLMVNALDSYENSILIEGESFSNLCEFVNELYDNNKLDLSSNANINISVCPKSVNDIMSMLSDEDCDFISEDDFENIEDWMDEDYYNE